MIVTGPEAGRRLRVVIDTNVLVSAFLGAGSIPAQVLELAIDDAFDWLVDSRLLAEYDEVLRRPKFAITSAAIDRTMTIASDASLWIVARPLPLTLPDPDDLPFLEVAVSGGADALVTGNTRDFRIPHRGKLDLAIVTPRQFLNLLAMR